MNIFVYIGLLGWLPAVLFLFAVLPPRRAVLAAFLVAWLFLPIAQFKLSGLPDYTKMSATCAGVLLATAIFDPGRLLDFRPRWADLPMLVWCLVPVQSSLSNDLGHYDALASSVQQTVIWGFPYLIGRLYFTDWAGLRALAAAMFLGGLVYVPLCLYEIRMSPQLHNIVYGYHQTTFAEARRFGGWRPMVFMHHGLMLGMWMSVASLLGIWLWRTGAVRRLGRWSVGPLVLVLLATTVACKSMGALFLLAVGLGLLETLRCVRTGLVVLALAALPPAYMLARTMGGWQANELLTCAKLVDDDRAESLDTRLRNETMLAERALLRPVWGWGGWGRSRVYDDETLEDRSITDGFWVIALGVNGTVGLVAVTAVWTVPMLVLLRRCRGRYWDQPLVGGAAGLAVALLLCMVDNLFNSMINPIFLLAAGGLSGLSAPYPAWAGQTDRSSRAIVQDANLSAPAARHRPLPRPVLQSAPPC
ncbi:MAG: O-antigen ligase domain-containing protein [Planctomycetota bacterium]